MSDKKIGFFVEYDWALDCYRFRINKRFTDFRGIRSLLSLDEWRETLKPHGFKLGPKTASRTWSVVQTDTKI